MSLKKLTHLGLVLALAFVFGVPGSVAVADIGVGGTPTGDDVEPIARQVDPDAPSSAPLWGATCTADCGDGTGWECTGPGVACEDGVGCAASNGEVTVVGLC